MCKVRKYIPFVVGVLFTISILILMISTDGVRLYEYLLIPIILFFYLIFLIIRKQIRNINNMQVLFTLAIVFFSLMQVWATLYENLPRVYGPGIKCQERIYFADDGSGNFSISFGNYGKTPAWIILNFDNTTTNLKSLWEYNNQSLVMVPINFQNNKQDEYSFNFLLLNSSEKFGFRLRILIYGDDIVSYSSAMYKIMLNSYFNAGIYNYDKLCNYTKENSHTYKLIN